MNKPPVVKCPHCGKEVVWDTGNRFRPFCSDRCKLIDLGQWANESYSLPDDSAPDQFAETSGHA